MEDDSIVKIIESLDLNYNPAINSTLRFERRIGSLNKQLAEMKLLALQGAKDINNSFSSQLGSMVGSKTIVDQWGTPLKTVQTEAAKVGAGITNSFKPATAAAKAHGDSVQEVAKKYNVLGSEFQRRAGWFASGTMFYGSIKASKELVQTIGEVETGMMEIGRVMEDSTFNFKNYRDELLQLGVDYGQSFEVAQDIALRWAQAGYGVKDSLENTKSSLLALNTAELDAKNATESLVGIMSQWKMTSADLPLLLDKINKTGDDFTITSQDLVDGLLRSSGAARIMNLSIDETISLLTVMREASGRTGQEVGNALNSILSYIQRPKSINVLESMGINMFADKAKTQFRNVMEVFKDIGSKWNTVSDSLKDGFVESADEAGLFNEELANALGMQEEWNDLQQRDLAQASAGVYRRNYYIGMIERLSTAQEVLNGLTNAAGYSQRENANTMDTLEKKYQSLKTAAQQLAVALGDAGLLDALKNVVDGATDLTSGLANINDEGKALITTALEIIAVLASVKGLMSMFTTKSLLIDSAEAAAILPGWTKLLAIIPAVIGAIGLYRYNLDSASSSIDNFKKSQDKIKNGYDSQIQAADKAMENAMAEAKTADTLAKKLEVLSQKENLNTSEKAQMKVIIEQLNGIFPKLGLSIDEQTGKIIGNTSAIYDNIGALKEQAIAQARQAKMQSTAEAYVTQELEVGKLKLALDDETSKYNSLMLNNKEALRLINEAKDNASKYGWSKDSLGRAIAGINQQYGLNNIDQQIQESKSKMKELSSQYVKGHVTLYDYDKELDSYVDKLTDKKSDSDIASKNNYIPSVGPVSSGSGSSGSGSYKNEALDGALKVLDYKKHINEMSIADEVVYLKNVKDLYINNSDELMDINKRIYDAEKALKDERLKISTDWINDKKNLGELSVDDEIAAWQRVLKNQSDNNEAVKQATINLYKLKKQLNEDIVKDETDNIQRMTKLGIYSIQEQISQFRKLYEFKATSIDEERQRVENLFDLYKKALGEQQNAIKDAYDERIRLIDEEADKEKTKREDKIKGIQDELALLDRKDSERSYEQTMSELQKDLVYWQARTSEDARKKVIEIQKQMQEEQYKHELELKKQGLNDKIDVLEDEMDEIDKASDEEKRKWEKSYKLTEKAFDEHGSSMIALAGAMSKESYNQWEKNYLIPLKNALASGDFKSFDIISGGLGGSIDNLGGNVINSNNAQIYRLANSILSLKRQWTAGDTSAAEKAKSYYNDLQSLGGVGKSVADTLATSDYERAKSYVNSLPRAHGGGETLSYGAVYMKPGELIFPPDLSIKMNELLGFLKGNTFYQNKTSTATDNRKDIKINSLVHIEKNYTEDKTDNEIFAREIGRMINAL